jgi:hypothetical protein
MIIQWRQGDDFLIFDGNMVRCSCNVRNELNKQRSPTEVVHTMPNKKPYYPRIFPDGLWKVSWPRERTDKERAPFFIPTDATQRVRVWDVKDGRYTMPTEFWDIDTGYGLHFSESKTTLGCIKIEAVADLLEMVKKIDEALREKEDIYLRVYPT